MPAFEEVAAPALELPEVQRGTPCGTPALEVGRRGGLMPRRETADLSELGDLVLAGWRALAPRRALLAHEQLEARGALG